jgi:predicted ATPase
MEKFRLNSLYLHENEFYRGSIKFEFTNSDSQLSDYPYITLLIGPNGTGKSKLLRAIIDIFNSINQYHFGHRAVNSNYNFILNYDFNKKNNDIAGSGKNYNWVLSPKDKFQTDASKKLPRKILAVSINLNDKFPTKGKESKNILYEYLGIRSFNNMAFTSGHVQNLITLLSDSLLKPEFLSLGHKIFSILNLYPFIEISYRNTFNLEKLLANGGLKLFILSFGEKNGFRYGRARNILKDESLVIELENFIIDLSKKESTNRKSISYRIDFTNIGANKDFINDYKYIDILRQLGLLRYSSIQLKKAQVFDFTDASSGEYHLLTSLLGIASRIEQNSLILIDEPEVSLHPNWQMEYISYLNYVFKEYSSCHFVIATHSHFLASGLKSNSSSILSLYRAKDGTVGAELLPFETNGWSVDSILYKIFNIATPRSNDLEMDLREVLTLISKQSNDYERVGAIYNKLKLFKLPAKDPLKIVLTQIKKYLIGNEYKKN